MKCPLSKSIFCTILFLTFTAIIGQANHNTIQADTTINDSILRRLAANMLMVGFKGDSVTVGCDAYRYVHDLHVGCLILFDVDLTGDATIGSRNITTKPRLKQMTRTLQQWSDQTLLIALDQEGGRVARLKPQYGFTPTVSAEYLGDINREDSTRAHAAIIASELAECGVNFNLAPIVDLRNDSCPVIGGLHRSFNSAPEFVAQNAYWFVDEHHRKGVICALKHFPGHGNSLGDTHYGLVNVTGHWIEGELLPYKYLIRKSAADAVMTAHIFNDRIDPDYPATLSKKTLTDMLRNKLKFKGIIVTDDLYMEGIISKYGIEEAIILAINAGADLLCAGNNIKTGFEADRPFMMVDVIVQAVKDGRIPVEKLIESERRKALARDKVKCEGTYYE